MNFTYIYIYNYICINCINGNIEVLFVSANARQFLVLHEIPASPHDPPVRDLTPTPNATHVASYEGACDVVHEYGGAIKLGLNGIKLGFNWVLMRLIGIKLGLNWV